MRAIPTIKGEKQKNPMATLRSTSRLHVRAKLENPDKWTPKRTIALPEVFDSLGSILILVCCDSRPGCQRGHTVTREKTCGLIPWDTVYLFPATGGGIVGDAIDHYSPR
jgi:hypothetical protein